ncbi:hypothetical protein CKG00_12725 [Morganella morganii]|uniref:Uncharacterized protein n=1 Tax=Morganella morganii TaxID=582 RepID=A0A433ZYC4_MORMO|nr:hypothetical protein [Morganella morganii]RUT67135.1 hypothetical protein CKG00_12725 [Morganella morganii]
MKKLYNIIEMGNSSGKEITLPAGKYHINNSDTIEPDEVLIPLSLPVPDSSLHRIEAELHENHYCVSFTTHSNEFIMMDISYNALFSYQGTSFFAIKEQHDTWDKSILSVKEAAGTRRRRLSRQSLFYVTLILSVILTAGFISGKNNMSENKHTANYKNIIYNNINNSEYIIKDKKILIFTSNENNISKIKNELPDYTIFSINKKKLKINKNDIIMTPDFNKRKEIIYMHQENEIVSYEKLSIPDEFRKDITISVLSFSDIVRLINNRFGQQSIRYSVTSSKNTIFIYSDQRRNKETDTVINDINTTIFSTPGNTLVQYRESTPREIHPGVYGSVNYIHLSDSNIKFISDNK